MAQKQDLLKTAIGLGALGLVVYGAYWVYENKIRTRSSNGATGSFRSAQT